MYALTGLIKSPHNPVGQFCRKAMPGGIVAKIANKKLSTSITSFPQGERKGYPYSLTGTAFDYRARLFFEPEFSFIGTVALLSTSQGYGKDGCENTEWFLWNATGSGVTPKQRGDDDYLARLCVIAAHLEAMYRTGVVSNWFLEAEAMTPNQLLASIPGAQVSDITQMAEKLRFAFSDRMPGRVVSNPAFTRPELNIGADGDIVLDDCLVDIKTTTSAKVSRVMLHQVVCYALLDKDNLYGIRKVGLYMARQGALIAWPLPELLMLLGGNNTNISSLRRMFEEAAYQTLQMKRDRRWSLGATPLS